MQSVKKDLKLLTPFTAGELSLKNRIVMAPLTRGRAGSERLPNSLMAEYYAQRASAGLIISEATVVSKQGIGWIDSPGIYNDQQQAGWQQIVETVHSKGGTIALQLWHCGRASHSSFHENGELPAAPSAVKIEGADIHTPTGKHDYEIPRPLETDEIPKIVQDYRRAAERGKAAGFDGIEIHSANGYLLDQFLQSKTNQRSDRYGGSLENRFRLLSEIIEAVLQVWPAGRIGVRLSPNGNFNDMGSPDYRETFSYAFSQLASYKPAYIHIVDGLGFGFHDLGEPIKLSEFKTESETALIGNCGYTLDSAEDAVKSGMADAIAFGRLYISNPDLAERFKHGQPLNDPPDQSVWFSAGPEGYTDFLDYQAAVRV